MRLVYQRGAFDAGVDRAGERGAVLVLLQPAVLRRQPAADAHVLLAAAAVDADAARALVAGRQRGRLARALQAARDRRHRARHGGLERRDDGAARHAGCGGSWAGSRSRARCARSAIMLAAAALLGGGRLRRLVRARPRCSAARCSRRCVSVGLALGARRGGLRRSCSCARAAGGAPDRSDLFARRLPARRRLVTCTCRDHGRPGPHPQLLDHRPHRPREVDAGRPHPRDDPHRRPARRCARSCSTRWTSSASAGSRSRRRRCASSTRRATARPTSST